MGLLPKLFLLSSSQTVVGVRNAKSRPPTGHFKQLMYLPMAPIRIHSRHIRIVIRFEAPVLACVLICMGNAD